MDITEAREHIIAAEEEITRIVKQLEQRTGLRFEGFNTEFDCMLNSERAEFGCVHLEFHV